MVDLQMFFLYVPRLRSLLKSVYIKAFYNSSQHCSQAGSKWIENPSPVSIEPGIKFLREDESHGALAYNLANANSVR